jgi:site-specific recombinase
MMIAGPDSKRQKAMTASIIAERTELRLRRITAARLEDEAIRIAASSIISWTGVLEEGKELAYSPSVALGLLTRYPFIREQVTSYANDRANFLKK